MADELKWYVAHTYSGYENTVAASVERAVENRNMGDLIQEVSIPMETVTEITENGPKTVERKVFPGYVRIKMVMTDETWHLVRNIRGVTGFVGPGSKPVPLTEEEAAAIIKEDAEPTTHLAFAVGDRVNIIDGVFRGYTGTLSEYNDATGEVTVIVSTVGRDIPVKLDKKYIEKVKE